MFLSKNLKFILFFIKFILLKLFIIIYDYRISSILYIL